MGMVRRIEPLVWSAQPQKPASLRTGERSGLLLNRFSKNCLASVMGPGLRRRKCGYFTVRKAKRPVRANSGHSATA